MLISEQMSGRVRLKWNDAAELITHMSEFRQRGLVCRDALLQTLLISKFNRLRQCARILSLPFDTRCRWMPIDLSFQHSRCPMRQRVRC